MEIKQKEIIDLKEEIEIILSIKDELSNEEINNFVDSFPSLTEKEIREKIAEVTDNNKYLIEEVNKEEQLDEKQINLLNETFKEPEITAVETIDDVSEIRKEEAEQIIVNKIEENKIEENREKNEGQIETVEELDAMLMDVTSIVGEVKHNQLRLQWQWPEKVNKIKVVYRGDSFAKSAEDLSAVFSVIKREKDEITGTFVIERISEGNFYFTIYAMAEMNGKAFYSEGKRRLIVNKKPIEIYYDLKIKRSLLGKLKSAEIIFSTEQKQEEGIKLPAIMVIGKKGNMPIQKSDGDNMCIFNEVVITKNELSVFELPVESIQNNMYIKLFVVNDKESIRYRIISPAKEKLYFK